VNRYIGIFLVAFTTLLTELVLTRVFDVVLSPNLAYMVITLALFSFGLAGVYSTLKPVGPDKDINGLLVKYSILYALCLILIRFVFNIAPFNYDERYVHHSFLRV
jgi:hypothetical protein